MTQVGSDAAVRAGVSDLIVATAQRVGISNDDNVGCIFGERSTALTTTDRVAHPATAVVVVVIASCYGRPLEEVAVASQPSVVVGVAVGHNVDCATRRVVSAQLFALVDTNVGVRCADDVWHAVPIRPHAAPQVAHPWPAPNRRRRHG